MLEGESGKGTKLGIWALQMVYLKNNMEKMLIGGRGGSSNKKSSLPKPNKKNLKKNLLFKIYRVPSPMLKGGLFLLLIPETYYYYFPKFF